MSNISARYIKNMPWGGAANQGQQILFDFTFHDGTAEKYACDLSLVQLLLGNLTQYAAMAEAQRVKMPSRTVASAAPYRVAKVGRSGHSPDGEILSVEFETTHGFPVGIAMTPDQARQTIEFLEREMLLAETGPRRPQGH